MNGPPRSRRPGFTLVELLIVVVIVAILAAIAIPAYNKLVNRARAASAVGDIRAVRHAAFSHVTENGTWPADVNPGILPPELEPYLGSDFSFVRDHYRLDWENWMNPDGTARYPGTGVLIGVSISTTESHLGQAVVDLVGESMARITLSSTHFTFILEAAP